MAKTKVIKKKIGWEFGLPWVSLRAINIPMAIEINTTNGSLASWVSISENVPTMSVFLLKLYLNINGGARALFGRVVGGVGGAGWGANYLSMTVQKEDGG